VLVAAALAAGGVSVGALLTAEPLRHPATALVSRQIVDNASEHCEHVNKVILLQCWEPLRACISPRVYRDPAPREEIVSSTRQAITRHHDCARALAVCDWMR
jgi:hypothetical protein